jgi:hypothetical protein
MLYYFNDPLSSSKPIPAAVTHWMIKVLEQVRIVKLFLALLADRSVWFHDGCWFSCEFDLQQRC